MQRPRTAGWVARLTVLLAAVAGIASARPATARADGDPASDTLIAQNVFLPYSTQVPAVARGRLNAAMASAARAGAAVKVALIAHPSDLGSVTALYEHPQRYASFLHTEISFGRAVRLIVVMPSGAGTAGLPHSVARAVGRVPAAGDASGAALAGAAVQAVQRVTAAARRDGPLPGAAGGSHTGRAVLLLALVLAAILVSGAIVILRLFFPVRAAPAAAEGRRSGRAAAPADRPRARSRRGG
jgi:hypothetical protein